MSQPALIAQARRTRLLAQVVRDEVNAVRAEARQRIRRRRLAVLVPETVVLVRELRALELALEHWDGVHPPPDQLGDRVEEVELRLTVTEGRLRQLRPRAEGSPPHAP